MPPLAADVRTNSAGHVFLSVEEDSKVASSTQFLGWTKHANSLEIPVHLAALVFLPYCSFDEDDATFTRLADVSALTFNLQAEAWTRVLSTLSDFGLFDETYENEHLLLTRLAEVQPQPQSPDLTLSHTDIWRGESFDVNPAVTPAARRAQQRAAATPPEDQVVQPGPPDLRFISLARVTSLTSNSAPNLGPLTRLLGMLGHCLTRRVRDDEMAGVRITAAILRQGVNTFLGAPGGAGFDNPVLAATLGEFLSTVMLHPKMKGVGLSEVSLRNEVVDSIMYVPTHSPDPLHAAMRSFMACLHQRSGVGR